MKLNTLEKLYLCMEYELPEIIMNNELINDSRLPIQKMLDISARVGM
jgi:quinolinate synthase